MVDLAITVLHKGYEKPDRSTCEGLSFIEQPLLVCWYVETFGHEFLHSGDLFVFSHLQGQQCDDVIILRIQNTCGRRDRLLFI